MADETQTEYCTAEDIEALYNNGQIKLGDDVPDIETLKWYIEEGVICIRKDELVDGQEFYGVRGIGFYDRRLAGFEFKRGKTDKYTPEDHLDFFEFAVSNGWVTGTPKEIEAVRKELKELVEVDSCLENQSLEEINHVAKTMAADQKRKQYSSGLGINTGIQPVQ